MSVRPPKYRLHKASGQSLVQINGQRIYLGKHGSEKSKERYRHLVAESLLSSRCTNQKPPTSNFNSNLTIIELIVEFMRFAKTYYVKNGTTTDEIYGLKASLRRLKNLYGHTPVNEFRPSQLKIVRQTMIDEDLSRKYINDSIDRIRRMFKWGVENEFVDEKIYRTLQAVSRLKKNRSKARETELVKPVNIKLVNSTLPYLSEVLQALVQFQLLTGCRPAEARTIRPCDIDKSGKVWVYIPQSHKTEHRNQQRRIHIGPKAQKILKPWLNREPNCYCFSPKESVRCDLKLEKNVTRDKSKPRYPRFTRRGDYYSKDSYNRAISRACNRAGIKKWTPNQLRHTRGTEIRKKHGLEASQTVLGHSNADVTQIYAERNDERAKQIMREIG